MRSAAGTQTPLSASPSPLLWPLGLALLTGALLGSRTPQPQEPRSGSGGRQHHPESASLQSPPRKAAVESTWREGLRSRSCPGQRPAASRLLGASRGPVVRADGSQSHTSCGDPTRNTGKHKGLQGSRGTPGQPRDSSRLTLTKANHLHKRRDAGKMKSQRSASGVPLLLMVRTSSILLTCSPAE